MLGAASEATLYRLADAVAVSLSDPAAEKKLRDAVEGTRTREVVILVADAIKKAKGKARGRMPIRVHENADVYLTCLQDSTRVVRNSLAHSAKANVERATVRLALVAFPGVCKKAHDLANWFRKNTV